MTRLPIDPCSTAPRAFITPTRGAAWIWFGVSRRRCRSPKGAIPIDWQNADDSVEPPDSLDRAEDGSARNIRRAPEGRPQSEAIRRLEARLRGLDRSVAAAEAVLRARTQAHVGAGRERARLPHSHAAGNARAARGAVETLRARYAPKVARLEEKRRKAQEQVEREQQQVSQQKLQTAVSLGATMLGALMGRERSRCRRSDARRLPHAASVGR